MYILTHFVFCTSIPYPLLIFSPLLRSLHSSIFPHLCRYDKPVLPFNRTLQQPNPEMAVCSALPKALKIQLARLEHVTQEMNIISRSHVCPEDDEDCSVDENRCDYTVSVYQPHFAILELAHIVRTSCHSLFQDTNLIESFNVTIYTCTFTYMHVSIAFRFHVSYFFYNWLPVQ